MFDWFLNIGNKNFAFGFGLAHDAQRTLSCKCHYKDVGAVFAKKKSRTFIAECDPCVTHQPPQVTVSALQKKKVCIKCFECRFRVTCQHCICQTPDGWLS